MIETKKKISLVIFVMVGVLVLSMILALGNSGNATVNDVRFVGGGKPEEQITVNFTGSTYKSVTKKPSGWFTSGQDADIMVSGIDFNNTGGPLLFNHQGNVASDGTRLLLADRNNNRVLIWKSLPTGNSPPDIVLGQGDFYANTPGTGLNKMSWPVSVATDGQHVVVADTYNDRVLIWNNFSILQNGTSADFELKEGIGWPWAVWTNGTTLVVASTACRAVLIWNSFPTSDAPADIFISLPDFGTPRAIASDGNHLVIGDHNAVVNGTQQQQGNFFWKTFPNQTNQQYDFFVADIPMMGQPNPPPNRIGSILWGAMTSDEKLIGVSNQLYIWNSFPENENDTPDLSVGAGFPGASGYDFGGSQSGDCSGVVVAGGRLYISLSNGNKIVVYNSLPTESDQNPDFAIGASDIYTNTLRTNYFITNPVPVSDGESLFVSSDFDCKLYVWKYLPDESGAKPDIVYNLSFAPWDSALFENTYVLAGRDTVCIWNTLPKAGELPDLWFKGTIGNVTFQELRGVALDNKYFYLADRTANKIYVWEGIPNNTTNAKFSIDIPVPTRLSSDGTYLVAAATEATFNEKIKLYKIDGLSSSTQPILLTGINVNLPEAALAAGGHLFIADTVFNRVLVWNNISDAVNGSCPEVVLGEEDFNDTHPEIGIDKLFWPAALTFDGSYLWVGEFKFSGRIVRFSVKAIPREPIYIDGNDDFMIGQNGVVSGNGTKDNPYVIEGWDINASTANGIYIKNTDVYFIIRNCVVHDGRANYDLDNRGIYFYNVQNGKIDNVTSYNNFCGIELDSASNNNTVTNCYVYNNSYDGIYLYYSSNNNLSTNYVHNNQDGIGLSYSSNNTLSANYLYNNFYDGIYLWYSSNNNVLSANYVYNNIAGIGLYESSNNNVLCANYVYNNSFYNNSLGINIYNSSSNTLSANNVYNNAWGIKLEHSSNNTLSANYAYNNDYGIYLQSSSNNLIYNNYFNNTNNAYSYGGSENRWNITKTLGANIVNGSYLGGNYWSDYTGTDTDGDGLGDTPYTIPGGSGEQDKLPLVKLVENQPPVAYIDSILPNPANQGQSVSFTGHGTDTDGDIVAYNWRSSIDGQLSTSVSFSTSTLSVGEHIIYFKVQDNNGTWSEEVSAVLIIIGGDTTPPVISDIKAVPQTQEVDGYVNIMCTVTDNVGVNVVKVNITYPNGVTTNITMLNVGINSYSYNTSYSVLGIYSYYIWADDISGNQNKSIIYEFTIRDTTPPIANAGLDREVNEDVEVELNASLSWDNVGITIWTWNFTDQGVPIYLYGGATHYTFTQPGYYVITLNVSDAAGNWAVDVFNITVKDITLPVISGIQATPSSQIQGGYVNITCTVTDNVAVSMVRVNIAGPAGFTPVNITMTKIAGTNNYYYNSPYSALGTYSYYIWANDTSNNQIISAVSTFEICTTNLAPVAVVLDSPTDITANSIHLSWSQNTDSDFDNYTIYQSTTSGNIGTPIYVINVSSTASYTVTGLSQSTTYYFTIRVYDTGNLYNDSNQVSGTTLTAVISIIEIVDGKEVNVTGICTGTINITSAVLPQLPPENLQSIGVQVNVTITGELTYANITIKYNDSDVADIDERKLRMHHWTGTEWKLCDNTGVDTMNNIVWANVTHLTIFVPMAEKLAEVTTGDLTGIVTDKNGKPIEGATVSIVAMGYETLTDANGRYIFTDVSASSYGVKVEKSGYKTKTETGVVINAGVTTTLNIVLEKEKKEEPKGFIPGFETFLLLIVLTGYATLGIRRRKRKASQPPQPPSQQQLP